MAQSVRVDVVELLQRVEEAREAYVAGETANFTKLVDSYPKRLAAWQKEMRKVLADVEKLVAKGKTSQYLRLTSAPQVPTIHLMVAKFDQDIALLRMSSSDTITVSTNGSWARYI